MNEWVNFGNVIAGGVYARTAQNEEVGSVLLNLRSTKLCEQSEASCNGRRQPYVAIMSMFYVTCGCYTALEQIVNENEQIDLFGKLGCKRTLWL